MTAMQQLPPSVHEAFASFVADRSTIALPLVLQDGIVQPRPTVHTPESATSFQIALNEVKPVLNPKIPMYLLLRRNKTLVAITFAPYLADATQRQFLLDNRHALVRQLGTEHFSQSLICKEIGEITDARSWNERDLNENHDETAGHTENGVACKEANCTSCTVNDSGYKRTKCRLCDRRMQNPITPDALDALRTLSPSPSGHLVQIVRCPPLMPFTQLTDPQTVDPTSQSLTLLLDLQNMSPEQIPSNIPPSIPTFTFYTHPSSHLLYFISHCPDAAPVRQRMTHTMAIPGLLVHAEDVGVKADRTMEIHDVEEAVFEEGMGNREGKGAERKEGDGIDKGKFRSVYRREGFVGTELGYAGLERDREFADAVR